jgi:hypothetical protein
MKFRLPSAQWTTRRRLADIYDLTPLIGRILHQPERARIRIPSRLVDLRLRKRRVGAERYSLPLGVLAFNLR